MGMKAPPLSALLRPVVRFCLRRGFSFQAFVESARDLFIDEASNILRASGEEPNVSRLSAMTGINRRQLTDRAERKAPLNPNSTMMSRVIGQWQEDRRFCSSRGRPKLLSYEGTSSEFHTLVGIVSKDLNPYTLLKELERSKNVERTADGLRLLARVFLATGKVEEGFSLLSEDIDDLVKTVEWNVLGSPKVPNLHLRTEYTRIRADRAAEVREWLLEEGSRFHANARKFLAALDLDIQPTVTLRTGTKEKEEGSVRVVLGTFGRVRETLEEK